MLLEAHEEKAAAISGDWTSTNFFLYKNFYKQKNFFIKINFFMLSMFNLSLSAVAFRANKFHMLCVYVVSGEISLLGFGAQLHFKAKDNNSKNNNRTTRNDQFTNPILFLSNHLWCASTQPPQKNLP